MPAKTPDPARPKGRSTKAATGRLSYDSVVKKRSIDVVDHTVLDASSITKRVRRLHPLRVDDVDTSLPTGESSSPALLQIPPVFAVQDTVFDLLPPAGLSLAEEVIDRWKQLEKKKYQWGKETTNKKSAHLTSDADWRRGVDTKVLTKEQFQALFLPAADAERGDGEGVYVPSFTVSPPRSESARRKV
ncbi:hypothetical protein CLCR_07652 [Cladophialophora carrionii]|uniref:Uncharacterized protein n=1 Tax=Cladophialophora carrionii TaxID=86049 RepID=A0A1C1CM80_9EURO|nr:hypothetical protein CLCR_07652 [Cladophialophora carrionii]